MRGASLQPLWVGMVGKDNLGEWSGKEIASSSFSRRIPRNDSGVWGVGSKGGE